jgi:biotin transport system substrate-specific component
MTIGLPAMARVPVREQGVTLGDFLVPIRISEPISYRVRNLALVLAGVLFVAILARISIPIPGSPVPISGQTFGVLFAACALGARRAVVMGGVYLAVGLIGFPVFADGASGQAVVVGATGGYLVGFVVAGALVGRLAELGWDRRFVGSLAAMVLGSLAIYAVGAAWLAAFAPGGYDLGWAIEKGVLPFLVGDAIKVVLAAVAFPPAWWIVGRRPGDR